MKKELLCFGLLIAVFAPAIADEVEEAAAEGLKLYQAGSLKEAASQWEYAATLARQQRADEVGKLLPEALPGWTLEENSNQGFSAGMLGGGVSISRTYTRENGNERVELQLLSDNPMMQSMSMMFSNPSMASMSGMKFKTIAGQRALVQQESQGYKLMFQLLNGQALLMLDANGTNAMSNAESYAKAIDFNALNAM